MNDHLNVTLHESRRFAPPARFSAQANLKRNEFERQRAQNPEEYWAAQAEQLQWPRRWERVRDCVGHCPQLDNPGWVVKRLARFAAECASVRVTS